MQDVKRVARLIEEAKKHCSPQTDSRLAELLGVSPQVLSNWKTGHKHPSIEAQCDIAAIAGISVPATAMLAMIENTSGQRQQRFQHAYASWMKSAGSAIRNLYLRYNTKARARSA